MAKLEEDYKERVTLSPGEIVAERYKIYKFIGRGGMGSVYAVEDLRLKNHRKALKLLWPGLAADESIIERLQREIICSYDICHRNVVRAFEYIREPDLAGFTMELIEGSNLSLLMEKKRRLNPRTVHYLIQEICSGLDAIHEAGIVHRDLKPSNILIARNGDLKISDFGIAYTKQEQRIEEDRGIVGTFAYLSPEYLDNRTIDQRSDIYSVGVMAYIMLTGTSPFDKMDIYERVQKIDSFTPIPVRARIKKCPEYLSSIISTCMQNDPEKRYQNVGEIIQVLRSSGSPLYSEAYEQKEASMVVFELFHKRRQLLQRILLFVLLILVLKSYFIDRHPKDSIVHLSDKPDYQVIDLSKKQRNPKKKEGLGPLITGPIVLQPARQLTETWTVIDGILHLTDLKVRIKNESEQEAKDVKVQVSISKKRIIELEGPTTIKANSSAFFEKSLKEKVTSRKALKLSIQCTNCKM